MKDASTILLIFLFSTSGYITAQKPPSKSAFSLRGGVTSIQGETTSEDIFASTGPEFGLLYSRSLSNEQWALAAVVSYSMINTDLSRVANPTVVNNDVRVQQTYAGLGVRYILNPYIREFQSYPGQFLPYLLPTVGALYTTNDLEFDSKQSSGYTLYNENTIDFAVSLEFGVFVTLSEKWAMNAYFGTRHAWSDKLDGVAGTGDSNDWLIRAGIGVQYHL